MHSFTHQTALITGAASGIGRELARQLSALGARVAGLDRSAEGLEQLGTELAGQSYAYAVADVTDAAAVAAAVSKLESQLGPSDLLIASAGIGKETGALDFSTEQINAQIQINLIGVVNSIGAVLPGMLARKRGHLAALSSLASYRGLPLMAGYCASKAGVNALLDSLRLEVEPLGLAVTTICPGWIRTPLTAALHIPPREVLEVDEAARIILRALSQRRRFIAFPTRATFRVRLLRYLPLSFSDWLARRYLKQVARWKKT